jgi:hypothetical protein
MQGLRQDLRHSLRLLARARGFALTAILVLGLGIGTNTAVFTVANALLLKPLAAGSGELAGVYLRDTSQAGAFRSFSFRDFQDLRAGRTPFASLAAQAMVPVGVTEGPATRKTFACVVTSDYFATLGATTSLGRTFRAEEESAGAPPAVVVASPARSRCSRPSSGSRSAPRHSSRRRPAPATRKGSSTAGTAR